MELLLQKPIKKRKYKKTKYIAKSKLNKPNIGFSKIIIIFILAIIFFSFTKRKTKTSNLSIKDNSNIKLAMCAIAKAENRYIKYFLEHYKKLGYDHIYLYDNNDIGEEPIGDLQIAKDLIKEGFLSIIEYRNKTGNLQSDAYHECYKENKISYDWISFIDLDEFLIILPQNLTLKELLNNPRFNNCESIHFNWKTYTDNDLLDFEDKSPMERFTVETNFKSENQNIKSFIRGNLDYNKIRENGSPHTIYYEVQACSPSGQKIANRYNKWPPDYSYGYVNHYVTKTVREYFYKRCKSKTEVENVDKIPKYLTERWFKFFFSINKKTKEKVDIYNQLFHTNYQ